MKQIVLLFLSYLCLNSAQAQLSTAEIDALVNRTLSTFDVPGISVLVVKDKNIVHAKGYGVRSLNSKLPVNENTLFGIASNSKAITAAALGILKEEGILTWDSKVTDFIPEFKMYDPYVTAEFTIRDLLTHRSGLGLGAGDLMFWPDKNDFTKADIIHNLRFLKPVSSFRSKYDYDNLLYIVAGEIVHRASGMSWEAFVQKRIFDPLEIKTAAPSFKLLKDTSNVIDPHFYVNGKLQVIRRDWSENANAAGGIYASTVDMSKWITCLLNEGKYGPSLEHRLFSSETLREMWTPQTLLAVNTPGPYKTNFSAYGLGWVITDVKGHKQMSHTGGLAGIVTQTTLIPDLDLAILVYTNQQVGAAFSAISNTIKDGYLGSKANDDWVDFYKKRVDANKKEADQILAKVEQEINKNASSLQKATFDVQGKYVDQWFGEAEVTVKNGQLWFTSKRSHNLTGPMHYYKGNTYIVRWTDRSMDADAYLVFSLDKEGIAEGIKVSPISPLTDFSFDFQDLNFKRK
jgi:CubicO group peptidase (beta-lactamase class C family)